MAHRDRMVAMFCRDTWQDMREQRDNQSKIKKMRLKALVLDTHGTQWGVYDHSVMIWSGEACCAWNARIKAMKSKGFFE